MTKLMGRERLMEMSLITNLPIFFVSPFITRSMERADR
jgi:hypothetical protein